MQIVPQIERRGKQETSVLCKSIRFIPQETAAGTKFLRISYKLLQIIVKDSAGVDYRIKWHNKLGMPGRFIVQFPDRMVSPSFVVGEGKKRRKIQNHWTDKVRQEGVKYVYDNVDEFLNDNKWLGETREKILDLFIQRIVGRN